MCCQLQQAHESITAGTTWACECQRQTFLTPSFLRHVKRKTCRPPVQQLGHENTIFFMSCVILETYKGWISAEEDLQWYSNAALSIPPLMSTTLAPAIPKFLPAPPAEISCCKFLKQMNQSTTILYSVQCTNLQLIKVCMLQSITHSPQTLKTFTSLTTAMCTWDCCQNPTANKMEFGETSKTTESFKIKSVQVWLT